MRNGPPRLLLRRLGGRRKRVNNPLSKNASGRVKVVVNIASGGHRLSHRRREYSLPRHTYAPLVRNSIREAMEDARLKIILLGPQGSGKTNLIARLDVSF